MAFAVLTDPVGLWAWWGILPAAATLGWVAFRRHWGGAATLRLADYPGYRVLVDSASDGVLVFTEDGTVADANPTAESLLGADVRERDAAGLFHPGHRVEDEMGHPLDPAQQPLNRVLRGELDHDRQILKIAFPDGRVRWLRSSVLAVAHPGAPRQVVARLRDITEERRTAEALHEARATFESLFLGSPNAVSVTRAGDGLVRDVNEAWCRLFGLRREEALGRTLVELGIWLRPEDRDGFMQRFEEGQSEQALPFTTVRHDGTLLHLSLGMAALRLQGEDCVLAMLQDHTHTREAERAQHRLDKAQSLGLMAAGLSHDFNNLFQTLLASLELAHAQADAPGRRILDRALSSLERASALSQRLMEFSGGSFTRPESVSLREMIQDLALQPRLGGAIDFQANLAAELSDVVADRAQLNRIVGILVENAAEAMAERGGTITLESHWLAEVPAGERSMGAWLEAPPAGPVVRLSLADTGGGVDPDVAEHMFEPFFSTKALGRGLGLPAALGMLRGNRGGLQVINRPGQGLAFHLYLPAGPAR